MKEMQITQPARQLCVHATILVRQPLSGLRLNPDGSADKQLSELLSYQKLLPDPRRR